MTDDDDFVPATEQPHPSDVEVPVVPPTPRIARRAKLDHALPAAAPDRAPPHSAEAEEHVIACCLLDGSDRDTAGALIYPTLSRAADLTPDAFYFPANRLLFQICLELRDQGQPVEVATLAEELKTRRQLEAAGGFAYLMQVTGKIPTTAHAGYFISKVREKHLLREAIRAHTQAVEEAYQFTGNLDEYLQKSAARVDAVRQGIDRASAQQKTDRLLLHRVQNAKPPKEPTTRLFLADKPVATPGNIVTLISKAKTGKTAALGAATAAIIAASSGTGTLRDTFKFRASNPNGHAVVVIDTEQSPYDAWQCYQRTLTRGGEDTDPKWLHHYALVGYSVPELHEALDLALAEAHAKHGGVFCLILDGAADFVSSVNDEAESNGFVTWLRQRTVTYDCPAICVIHSNEGEKAGDDGRGHLGKQLIRKAESNLLLKKASDVTIITSDKQRKAPITEKDGVAFEWSDEQQMHVSCAASLEDRPKGGRPAQFQFSEFASIFPTTEANAMSRQSLYRYAQDMSDIKDTTFRNLLHTAFSDGTLKRTSKAHGFMYWMPLPGDASSQNSEPPERE